VTEIKTQHEKAPRKPHSDWWTGIINRAKTWVHEYRAKREREALEARAARVTARATVWIAVFTVVLACATILSWWELQDGGRLDRRAWLGVQDIPGEKKIGEVFSVVVHTKNTGRTPAINMHFQDSLDLTNRAPDVALDCAVATKNTARALIAPDGVHSLPLRGDPLGKVDENWQERLSARSIYIHGCLLYDDIFKGRHWLTFCAYWKDDIAAFENCEIGNDTGDGEGPKRRLR
jgi:hypothetical protein